MQDIQSAETPASVDQAVDAGNNSLPCKNILKLYISGLKWVSEEVVTITPSEGASFFIRLSYLQQVHPDTIIPGACFADDQVEDLLCAASTYLAERVAMAFLLRREHSAFQLECKLKKKGISDDAIALVLPLLRKKNYLCDSRFAEAWLRNRSISHCEGSGRLVKELLVRGVSKIEAQTAVANFFENVDEDAVFARAVQKELRKTTDLKKLALKLQQKGFSFAYVSKNIKKYINNVQ